MKLRYLREIDILNIYVTEDDENKNMKKKMQNTGLCE